MSIRQAAEPVPLADVLRDLVLAHVDERASWLQRVLAADESGYGRGLAAGVDLGRRLEAAERDAAWQRIARPIARSGPSYDELERRRWQLRGQERTRQTFGRPHPDDYRGHGAA